MQAEQRLDVKTSGLSTRHASYFGAARVQRLLALAFVTICFSARPGDYPIPLKSKLDIALANATATQIAIARLPVRDYPKLSKFTWVKRVDFYAPDGKGGSDEKLKALASLTLENLADITLLNCPLVADEGIRALSGIGSLRELQLEGTSITDFALQIIARDMNLTGVNVANCPKVTAKGVAALAFSDTLRGVTFSADNLTQEEVLATIGSFKNVTECQVIDPKNKLNLDALNEKSKARKIKIVVRTTGALQDINASDEDLIRRAKRGASSR